MIKTVTITGADDSVTPQDIANMGMDFPFSEWAILFSRRSQGGNRFPTIMWIKELIEIKKVLGFKLSCHLCGSYVNEILKGDIGFISEELAGIFKHFERVQINTHGIKHTIHVDKLIQVFRLYPKKEFIFQYDNVKEHDFALKIAHSQKANVSALFDLSHGAGTLPEEWPDLLPNIKCGYAGGISPENILYQCAKITEKTGQIETWIDMETHVRSNGDLLFDLNKVDKCLSRASDFIS